MSPRTRSSVSLSIFLHINFIMGRGSFLAHFWTTLGNFKAIGYHENVYMQAFAQCGTVHV